MVRGAGRLAILLLIAALVAPLPGAAADTGTDSPDTVPPRDHPFFAQLPPVPDAVRLWAQMSSDGDAFLTLREATLPHPYTPAPSTDTRPALVFETFGHITTNAASKELQYTSRPTHAAWNGTLHPERPIVAEWILSTGVRGVDAGTTVPPLLVTTTVKAIAEDGFQRILATRTVRAQPDGEAHTRVPVSIHHLGLEIPQGSRLVVELDWSWMRLPGVGALRQPLVTVHPGSYIDLPLEQPVRIVSLKDRMVAGQLYVEAKVAHLFAVENIALGSTNLVLAGPSVQMQGGRALVTAPRDGPDQGHVATFDWRLPVGLDHLTSGTYDVYVTAGQVNEPGPRVVAAHPLTLTADEATAPSGLSPSVLLLGLVLVPLAAVALRRRLGT